MMFKKANNTNEIVDSMERNLQEEYVRDEADANKLKAEAIVHLSKASLLFKEIGKTTEAFVVNNLIKTAKDKKKSKSPEMRKYFKWLGFKSEDLDFCGDHLDGQMALDVEWPNADEIKEHVEGQERDPRAQRNYQREDILQTLYNVRNLGEQDERLKEALQVATMMVIRSAEAEQELDEDNSQEYLNKAKQVLSALERFVPTSIELTF